MPTLISASRWITCSCGVGAIGAIREKAVIPAGSAADPEVNISEVARRKFGSAGDCSMCGGEGAARFQRRTQKFVQVRLRTTVSRLGDSGRTGPRVLTVRLKAIEIEIVGATVRVPALCR